MIDILYTQIYKKMETIITKLYEYVQLFQLFLQRANN